MDILLKEKDLFEIRNGLSSNYENAICRNIEMSKNNKKAKYVTVFQDKISKIFYYGIGNVNINSERLINIMLSDLSGDFDDNPEQREAVYNYLVSHMKYVSMDELIICSEVYRKQATADIFIDRPGNIIAADEFQYSRYPSELTKIISSIKKEHIEKE